MQANTVFCHNNKTYSIGEAIDPKKFTTKELKELKDKELIAEDVVKKLKAAEAKKEKAIAAKNAE